MAQSLAQTYVHIVYSTKNRFSWLDDRALRDETHRYLHGACRNQGCPALAIGGVGDHVHLLVRLGKVVSVADLVKELKTQSTRWLQTKTPGLAEFHWQNGYGAFSISPAHVEALCQYIERQEEHHRTETFQEEFRRLLRKYGLEWDERYVWD